MGKSISKLFKKAFGKKKLRVLLLGLDNSGKTTVLRHMQGKTADTVPTQGFNVETVKIGNINCMMMFPVKILQGRCGDTIIGGPLGLSSWLMPAMLNVSFDIKCDVFWEKLMFPFRNVVCNQPFARRELHGILREEELEFACVVILCNKIDEPRALSVDDVKQRLQLDEVMVGKNKDWTIQATNARTGQGLKEAFQWLCEHMLAI